MASLFSFTLLALSVLTVALPEPKGGGNSQCAQWCADNFPQPGKDCTSLAAKGRGPCYDCGPAAPQPPTQILCNGACVPISNENCGTCGEVCTGGQTCQNGQCTCPSGQTDCSGTCKNLNTDQLNCGGCGTVCTGVCQNGACTCPATDKPGGSCGCTYSLNCDGMSLLVPPAGQFTFAAPLGDGSFLACLLSCDNNLICGGVNYEEATGLCTQLTARGSLVAGTGFLTANEILDECTGRCTMFYGPG
jgi:hypothetical protein